MCSDSEVTGVLELLWVNQKTRKDNSNCVIHIPVRGGTALNSYLEAIYLKTAELASDSELSQRNVILEKSKIHLFQNGSELTIEEYAMPIEYFANIGSNRQAQLLSLITGHCGTLFVSVLRGHAHVLSDEDASPTSEHAADSDCENSTPIVLEFDLSLDTIGDLKTRIEASTGLKPDFIFTRYEILDYPEKLDFDETKIRDVQNLEEIMIAQKSSSDDIVIELEVKIPWRAGRSEGALHHVLIVQNTMTPTELETMVKKLLLGIPEFSEAEIMTGQLLLIPGKPTLDSCNIKNGTKILFARTNYSKLESNVATPSPFFSKTINQSGLDDNRSSLEEAILDIRIAADEIYAILDFESEHTERIETKKAVAYSGNKNKVKRCCTCCFKVCCFCCLLSCCKPRHKHFSPTQSEGVPVVPPSDIVKWTAPKKGLNLRGSCDNPNCLLRQNGVPPLVHWSQTTFDLSNDHKFIRCPLCHSALSIQAPVFHMTQWKYYGHKLTTPLAQAKHSNVMESEDTGNANSNEAQNVQERSIELVKCDWQVADAKSDDTVSVLDKVGIKIEDFSELVLLTRPLEKSKRRPLVEQYRVGLSVSVPLVCTVMFNFDMFRDYRK